MSFTDTQIEALSTEVAADHLMQRDGRTYVSQHYVFSKANEIFGIEGWTYHAPNVHVLPNGVCYASVTVTVGDKVVTDVGTGVGNPERPQSYETAIKDAVTDGVKRGLRTIGIAFGLNLYDKESELHGLAAGNAPAPARQYNNSAPRQQSSAGTGTAPWPRDVPQDVIPDNPVCEVSGEEFTGYTSGSGKVYDARTEAAWAFHEYGRIVKKRYANQ